MHRLSVNVTESGIYVFGAKSHFDRATFESAAYAVLKDMVRGTVVIESQDTNWVAAVEG